MYYYYTDRDEELTEEQAELLGYEIELTDGQIILEAIIYNGFNR